MPTKDDDLAEPRKSTDKAIQLTCEGKIQAAVERINQIALEISKRKD